MTREERDGDEMGEERQGQPRLGHLRCLASRSGNYAVRGDAGAEEPLKEDRHATPLCSTYLFCSPGFLCIASFKVNSLGFPEKVCKGVAPYRI